MSDMIANDQPGEEDWIPGSVTLGNGKVISILTIPAASGYVTYVLPQIPSLVNSTSGEPMLSLSLILSRQPGPEEDSVYPLIESALLTMDVRIGIEASVLDAMFASCQGECRRLFARSIDYQFFLSEDDQKPPVILTQAKASGSEGRTGISVHLDHMQALDVLAALDSTPSRLHLSATIHYQTAGISHSVHLSGSWAAMHDFISGYQDDSGYISETQLYQLISDMAEKGLLMVTEENGSPIHLPSEDLVHLFMRQAMVILRREPDPENDKVRYALRPRPYEGFGLSYTESIVTAGMKTCELCTSLDQIIGGILKGRNWTEYVHLVAKESNSSEILSPVPKKVHATRSRRGERSGSSIKMAAIDNSLVSLSLAALPGTFFTPLPNQGMLHPSKEAIHHIELDDFRLDLGKPINRRSLPVVGNRNAPYWSDRIDANKLWYAPVYEIIEPEPNADPGSSPFLFSFERFGATGTGEPALRGSVRFTLRFRMSEETESALSQINLVNKAQPVNFENLSVSLLVPFVDETDGRVKQHFFEAAVQKQGDTVIATVSMLNEWVRLTYGALAIEDFQESSAQVQVAYTFKSYVPVEGKNLELAFGGKAIYTPVTYSSAEASALKGTPYLDATTLTHFRPVEEVHYIREASGLFPRLDSRFEVSTPVKFPVLSSQPVTSTAVRVRPQLTVATSVASLIKKVKYAIHTEVQQQIKALLVPCNLFGNFYQEIRNEAPASIGCQDAFKLGRISYNQYEEISALRDPAYLVYRSLQQPGHFLVVPASFCISRRTAGETDAYRPLIFLNALIDSAVASNNRVELRATLEPDLPLFKLSALLEQLKAYDQNPKIHYPTDIPYEKVDFNWAMHTSITASSEADLLEVNGPFISAYFSMGLPDWQLMRSVLSSPGLGGSVSFTLADGSKLVSNLLLKLDRIRGPWHGGPLEVASQDGKVKLSNRIERAIDVSDLVRYAGNSVAERVPVGVSLVPDQTFTVSAGSGLQPVYSYPPGDPVAIEEVRSFVEDIYSNLIFINLTNFGNHNLLRLDVEARLQGLNSLYTAQLTEELPVADIPIVLPLTTYLEKHILDFRVIKIFNNRSAETTEWIQWDLGTAVPISLTRELLGL